MLPKQNRADRKAVEEIFKKGRTVSSPGLNFKFLKTPGVKRISFIVPKSVAKSAVKRNMLRRRGYKALVKVWQDFKSGITGAFILRSPALTLEAIKSEIKNILSKIG